VSSLERSEASRIEAVSLKDLARIDQEAKNPQRHSRKMLGKKAQERGYPLARSQEASPYSLCRLPSLLAHSNKERQLEPSFQIIFL